MEHTGIGGGVLTSDPANAAPADRKFFGSCIIEAESLEAARKIIENDVYYTAGVVSVLSSSDTLLGLFFDSWHGKWDKEKLQVLPIMLATPLPPLPS